MKRRETNHGGFPEGAEDRSRWCFPSFSTAARLLTRTLHAGPARRTPGNTPVQSYRRTTRTIATVYDALIQDVPRSAVLSRVASKLVLFAFRKADHADPKLFLWNPARNRRNITGRLPTILLEITNDVTRRRQSAKISRGNFYTYTIKAKRFGVSTHSQTKTSAYKRPKPVKVETNKKLFEVDYFK